MTQINTSNSFRNPSIAYYYANIAGNNAVTIGVSMILAEAFTEDQLMQLIQLKNEYSTIISEKCNLVYRLLAQKNEPIGEFYSKLLKYGKMLNLDEQQIKANLFEILEQIEMRRAEKKLGLVSKLPQSSYKLASKLITPTQSQSVSSQLVF
ncbi:17222_t:CDS:2 [Dentiscutata erythropus]|uniref:17222_t:CDS:1 n=1 Tax=Dentiscutata erythropus TaxID=1348616 RepID=A0A9N8W5Q9_9GLOM|nr:17222_t:CDS:2 [Dentiscutata erythropus]